MKQFILKMGHIKTVILITFVSVILSVLISLIISLLIDKGDLPIIRLLIFSIAIPIIVAPLASTYLIDMLFKIHRLETEMRELATYDFLTGLLNRRVFLERANYLFGLAKRENQDFSILTIDIDNFKLINDQHGHIAGDQVLSLLGKIIAQVSRVSDVSGRTGGEEFAFFLPHTSASAAMIFTDRLQAAIKKSSIDFKGSVIKFTVSIGLASSSKNNQVDLESVLHTADLALYEAKKLGKNQTVAG